MENKFEIIEKDGRKGASFKLPLNNELAPGEINAETKILMPCNGNLLGGNGIGWVQLFSGEESPFEFVFNVEHYEKNTFEVRVAVELPKEYKSLATPIKNELKKFIGENLEDLYKLTPETESAPAY